MMIVETVRLHWLLGALALATTPVPGQQKVDARVAVTRDVHVRINGAFGELRVTGWEKDSLVLTGLLPKDARLDGMGGMGGGPPAKGLKFYIEGSSRPGGASGSLELFVPFGATVWAKSGSARIAVQGVTGGLDLNIVGGSITVTGNPRELNVESMDGAVEVTGAPVWMRAKTATGAIVLRGSCTDAGVTTVAGAVTLRDGTFERTRIETVTGDVTFAGAVARAGSLTIDSHSGTISMHVGAGASVDVEATTIIGDILNSVTSRRPAPGREGRGAELTLTLGTGDAHATLRSFKGNIRLTR
ncbi:MAG TPA: hypothetical protein VF981_17620 [Gemmatimonadaceae bacterium]